MFGRHNRKVIQQHDQDLDPSDNEPDELYMFPSDLTKITSSRLAFWRKLINHELKRRKEGR